ncbi:MAG: HEPN domain-containing protein [Saprospirales bacterium]|nr:HEPN domain-containing protein [Saprospirales bacterium]
MSYSKEELVRHRIERARESLQDAEYLLQEERWNGAANRMYYACFYVVSAYMAFKGLTAATHSGLKSAFNQELIKTGRIDRSDGVLFNRLFAIRQRQITKTLRKSTPEETGGSSLPKINGLILDIEGVINEENSPE